MIDRDPLGRPTGHDPLAGPLDQSPLDGQAGTPEDSGTPIPHGHRGPFRPEINYCEAGRYGRRTQRCRRWGQFYLAADIDGETGLHSCAGHLGQAIITATERCGRTSVLVQPLTDGLSTNLVAYRSSDGQWEVRHERGRLRLYSRRGKAVEEMASAGTMTELKRHLQALAGISFADLLKA